MGNVLSDNTTDTADLVRVDRVVQLPTALLNDTYRCLTLQPTSRPSFGTPAAVRKRANSLAPTVLVDGLLDSS
jgi:hypothetical protein